MEKAIHKYLDQNIMYWFDLFSEGIVVTDGNMVVEYINPLFSEYSGLSKEQIIGKPLPEVRPNPLLINVMKSGKSSYSQYRKLGDTESYVDDILLFEKEKVIGALIIVRDKKVLMDLFCRIKHQNEHILQLNQSLKSVFKVSYSFQDIIGADAPFVNMARKAARTDSPVLLIGESGTGKEVVAQSIHEASSRSSGPFIDINCAALPETLLESELFGYSSGTFTGAKNTGKIGLFELANGGTLFLDEITEMPLSLQSKLLRVLQEKKIRRLGDTKNIALDVRIIAATNQTVEEQRDSKLRNDLFYRLAVFIIKIPPLRERRKDIPLFIKKYMAIREKKDGKKYIFSSGALNALKKYAWPGNIRQLKNAIEYACDVSDSTIVECEDLPAYIFKKCEEQILQNYLRQNESRKLSTIIDDVEKQVLQDMLKKHGSALEAKKIIAGELGISIATLYNKLRRFGCDNA